MFASRELFQALEVPTVGGVPPDCLVLSVDKRILCSPVQKLLDEPWDPMLRGVKQRFHSCHARRAAWASKTQT